MYSIRVSIATLCIVAAGCDVSSTPAPAEQPVPAAYGQATFRIIENRVVRDTAYPPGTYDVPLDVDRALAFDGDSVRTTICARRDATPFELNGNVKYYRFQCDTSWNSRAVVFVADTQLTLRRGEMLEWKKLDGEPPLAPPKSVDKSTLHGYAQIATPTMLGGLVLVSAGWFSGEYPPPKEFDALRGDSITFGHYTMHDRALFIGESPTKPSTYLLRGRDTISVREPLEWAFVPDDASEKNESRFSSLFEIPGGYLVRVFQWHDHEGFGVDEFTNFYTYTSGRWRLFSKAERFRAY